MEPPSTVPGRGNASSRWTERAVPLGAWLLGFLVVVLLAGNDGGFFPSAWAWAAFATWLLTAVAVALRPPALSGLDLTMAAGALAFWVWFVLSALWSRSVPSTLDEAFRYLAYAGILAAALVVVERRTMPRLLGGVTAAIALMSLYALGTRLLPDRLGAFESILGYRLTGTIGYWNGLGIFAVTGLLLALGFAARAQRAATRALAAAALPVLAATMYFTFSRGAWLALLAGLAAAVALDPRRLQLLCAGAVLGVLPAIGVLLAARSGGLTQPGAAFADAVGDGHRLLPVLALLAALSAGVAALLPSAERRVRVPRPPRIVWGAVLVAVALVVVAALSLRQGSPAQAALGAWGKAHSASQATGNNGRLLDLSPDGRVHLWRAAWDTFSEHPVGGAGGGTYWQEWAESRYGVFTSTEGHSVYAETLAELGVVGFVLLLAVLVAPLVGAIRARRAPLAPFALAGFAGWVVHAGLDWDWELVGVSGAALLCGVALVAGARRAPRPLPRGARGGAFALALLLAAVAATSVLSSQRLDAARAALGRGDLERAAADAGSARRFTPWSTRALEVIAAVRLDQGRRAEARRTYREVARRDPRSWIAWAHLAELATGRERLQAVAAARVLNPGYRGPQA